MGELFLDGVEVLLPGGEEGVELLPVAQPEGPVHRRGHVHHALPLLSLIEHLLTGKLYHFQQELLPLLFKQMGKKFSLTKIVFRILPGSKMKQV